MRRQNRYGTVYKMSGNRRKPFIARAYVGKDKYGKSVYKTIGYYKSKSEGNMALEKYNANPYDLDKQKLTLKDVYDLFIEEHKKDISVNRFKNIKMLFNVLSPLHNEKFIKLRPMHFQNILDKYGENHKKSTIRAVKALMHQLYEFAIIQDITQVNYAKGIVPRGQGTSEQSFFTDLEVEKIKKASGVIENADMLLFMCFTGIRPQELFNITKFNVDFENGLITGIGVKTYAGKNKKVVILDIFKPYLKERYDKATDYIFVTKKGNPLKYNHFREKIYIPLLKQLKIPYKPPKACRHYFATLTNQKGINSKAIQTTMGHTNINLTNEVYTHAQDEFLKKEIKKIES